MLVLYKQKEWCCIKRKNGVDLCVGECWFDVKWSKRASDSCCVLLRLCSHKMRITQYLADISKRVRVWSKNHEISRAVKRDICCCCCCSQEEVILHWEICTLPLCLSIRCAPCGERERELSIWSRKGRGRRWPRARGRGRNTGYEHFIRRFLLQLVIVIIITKH